MAQSTPIEGVPSQVDQVQARGWQRTFSSLRHRDYRLFWFGLLAFYSAMQMQQVAQGWLVYDMTGSAESLGLVVFSIGLPLLLLSPIGGVAADRVDKRYLLMASQVVLGIISASVAILVAARLIEVWHLMAVSAVKGIIFAFNMPARQAFIAELAPENDLMNAVALNSSGMNLTRVVAPAAAGILIGFIGVAGVYWLMVGLYAIAMVTLMAVPPHPPRARATKPVFSQEITAGVSYIARHPLIPTLILLELITVLFAMQYQPLMPVFAVRVLDAGPDGLGYLLSAVGIGGLFGSLLIASLGTFQFKGRILLAAGFLFGVGLFLFAQAPSFPIALAFLSLTGIANIAFTATNNTLIMSNADTQVRGRVMSVYLMCWGAQPLATYPVGALVDTFGPQAIIAAGGLILTVATVSLAIFRPCIRAA